MKFIKSKISFVVIVSYLMIATVFAQDPPVIRSIHQQYAQINDNIKAYRVVKKNLLGYSAEGGVMQAYFDNGQIKKIKASFLGETGRAVEEFYFNRSKLIFAYRVEIRYDKPFGKIISMSESRYYFNQGKMIRWIKDKGKSVSPNSAEFRKKSGKLIQFTNELVSKAK